MASTTKRKKGWSYSTGEWGANRIRAYDRGAKGIFLEFYESEPGTAGKRKRVRMALGYSDREAAKTKADEIALAFRRHELIRLPELTLSTLFDSYEREVSREKGESKRKHDERCAEMFLRFLGTSRNPRTLSRLDWDRFIAERRRGTIAPAKVKKARKVGERVIAYDLKWLLSVLNWAMMAGDGRGGVLLERNPLKGLPLPKEESPRRSVVTAEQYAALLKAAARMAPLVKLLLVLAHETGHRIGSVRQLRWSDVDVTRKTVTWRPENDKIGFGHATPLTDFAAAALKRARKRQRAIGDAWVFPAPADAREPYSRHLVRDYWERLAETAKLPKGQRFGWHSLRRKFASELKATPLRDLAHLGGWKSAQTILTCYIAPDEATQRAALAHRKSLRASGLS